jgi:hypothetical protein
MLRELEFLNSFHMMDRLTINFILPSVGKNPFLHFVMAAAPTQWMVRVVCMPSLVK